MGSSGARAGGRLVRVDVSGFRYEDLAVLEPKEGADIRLAVNVRIQKLAEDVLGRKPGSVVILSPQNGDVLAMASAPGFDPNLFIPSISSSAWKELILHKDKPLLNRAVAGTYAPGSTFKPIVAFAALENNRVSSDVEFECPGYFHVGEQQFRCWASQPHGALDFRGALRYSCNVFFYRLGLDMGPDYIYHMASAMGLGRKTGIDIDFEQGGILPDDSWSRKTLGHGWRAGDTCNFSIGQGSLAVTPLQMAVAAATIANGGIVYRPRLLVGKRASSETDFEALEPLSVNTMNWRTETLGIVRQGMREVVMEPDGTGRSAFVGEIEMGGKTGTAEFGPKNDGKNRGWMIAFVPYHEPRYAIAVVLDEANTGGTTVAPLIKQLVEGLVHLDPLRTEKG